MLEQSKTTKYISEDSEMSDKVQKIQKTLQEFKGTQVNDVTLLKILKTQELVKEIFDDAS